MPAFLQALRAVRCQAWLAIWLVIIGQWTSAAMGADTHTTRPLPLRITVVYNNVTQTPAEEQGQVLQSSNCVNLKDRLFAFSCHTNFTHLSQQRVGWTQ